MPGGVLNPVPDRNNLSKIIAGLKGGRVRIGTARDMNLLPLKQISLDKATKERRAVQEKSSTTCNFAGSIFGIPKTVADSL